MRVHGEIIEEFLPFRACFGLISSDEFASALWFVSLGDIADFKGILCYDNALIGYTETSGSEPAFTYESARLRAIEWVIEHSAFQMFPLRDEIRKNLGSMPRDSAPREDFRTHVNSAISRASGIIRG